MENMSLERSDQQWRQLERLDMHLVLGVNQYDGAKKDSGAEVSWAGDQGSAVLPGGEAWDVIVDGSGAADEREGLALSITFRSRGVCDHAAVMWGVRTEHWSEEHYVLVPGAVYGGNRFPSRPLPYAPCWTRLPQEDRGAEAAPLITDVPRLSMEPGEPSGFHLLTGDASVPAMGFFDPERRTGWFLMTEQGTTYGDTSMHVEESADRLGARLLFQAPGVRPDTKYEMTTTRVPSPDRGARFEAGDAVTVRCRLFYFACGGIPALFERLSEVRKLGLNAEEPSAYLPFSAAWAIQEDKYNRLNWKEKHGYYAVGTVDMKHQDWQVGWVGGGMSSYALLAEGSALSIERALSTLSFMFGSQTESGFFRGVFP
jgi:hypothetical protein